MGDSAERFREGAMQGAQVERRSWRRVNGWLTEGTGAFMDTILLRGRRNVEPVMYPTRVMAGRA